MGKKGGLVSHLLSFCPISTMVCWAETLIE
jgi:hypothetical protein